MMIDLVFDYMAAKGVVFYSQEEMKTAEAGIREYLRAMASRKKKTTNITVITCTGGWISSTLRT